MLSLRVQQLEAPEPHSGLRVHVDAPAVIGPEPQQPLHPAHPANASLMTTGFIVASAQRKSGPHFPV